ncbi:FlgD immunoglobulin-like domain containing protein [Micromonospora avicenniae]|uniref:FlgD Ig-like domain-containing protein n=1 Tax=Micromonospora avicenniae TaxID=1198245 RepID=A0A1N6UDJ2_9ACTN|nr:FlgD immunoglobulin-like domain containing protein [Micromonospora avicenniae]SIQ63682.1 FlgD Ig-like domain-containing protein [Micromonospora avicenniae]
MASRLLVRAGIAAVAALALAGSLNPLVAGPAQAEPVAGEVVVPASISLLPQTELLTAGPSGFLRREPGRGHLWTSYTGLDTAVDTAGTDSSRVPEFGAGSDVVALYKAPRTVTLRDMTDGRSRTVTLPAGHSYVTSLGWTVVTRTESPAVTWRLLDTHEDGTFTQREVTGVPTGIEGWYTEAAPLGDPHGQIVQYRIGSTGRTGWLDADQARFVPLPYDWPGTGRAVLTATHLLWWQGGTVYIHSRDDLTAAPTTVPLTGEARLLGMVGETLVVARYDATLGSFSYLRPVWRIDAVALDGTTVKTLLARSQGLAMPTPTGGLLVPGGPTVEQWGVFLVEESGGATIRRIADSPLSEINAVEGLTYTQGRLNTLEYDPAREEHRLYTRDIGVAGTPTIGERAARGVADNGCAVPICVDLYDTGDGRTVVAGTGSGSAQQPHLLDPTQSLPGTRIVPTYTYQSVSAVSGRFAALWSSGGGATSVIDLDTRQLVYLTPAQVEAMWGTTAWLRDGNQAVVPVDVLTGQRGAPVWFGDGCLLQDVQAVGRWLLWLCVGATPRQGIYDTVNKTQLALDSGPEWLYAKLGDGFVVVPGGEDNQLKVVDFRSGSPTVRTADDLSPWDPWDVDPHTGVIAHLAADGSIHLVPSGVPVSPLVQIDATVATSLNVKNGGQWRPKWRLSKPAGSWTLEIKRQTTGVTVRTLTGGESRGLVTTAWSGTDRVGRQVENGTYTWTLTATPADGQGAALTRSGTVTVSGAFPSRG